MVGPNRSWNDKAKCDLFIAICTIKNIGTITTFEWEQIGTSMRELGHGFSNEGCRQRYQTIKKEVLEKRQNPPSPQTEALARDPHINPILRRPGPGRRRDKNASRVANAAKTSALSMTPSRSPDSANSVASISAQTATKAPTPTTASIPQKPITASDSTQNVNSLPESTHESEALIAKMTVSAQPAQQQISIEHLTPNSSKSSVDVYQQYMIDGGSLMSNFETQTQSSHVTMMNSDNSGHQHQTFTNDYLGLDATMRGSGVPGTTDSSNNMLGPDLAGTPTNPSLSVNIPVTAAELGESFGTSMEVGTPQLPSSSQVPDLESLQHHNQVPQQVNSLNSMMLQEHMRNHQVPSMGAAVHNGVLGDDLDTEAVLSLQSAAESNAEFDTFGL